MALSPQERKARRDERARATINPDTGKPFASYNQMDTWQRNQKAKAEGFKSRAQKRYQKVSKPLIEEARKVAPASFEDFLSGRTANETLAREFNKAFGKVPPGTSAVEHKRLERARKNFLAKYPGFNWTRWRDEYSATGSSQIG